MELIYLIKSLPLTALFFVLISAVTAHFLFPSSVSGDDFAGWLVQAAEYNTDMRQAEYEARLAELEKKKGLIEARNEEQQLTVEITYLTKRVNLRQKRVASFVNILDAAVTAVTAEIDLRIAELQYSIAEETKDRSERLFREGRISDYEADAARIDYQDAEADLLQARRTLEEAERDYIFTTGTQLNSTIFDISFLPSRKPTEAEWIEHDYAVVREEKELQLSLLRRDLLSASASTVEKQKADIAVEQARLGVDAVLFESRSGYRELVFSLESVRRRIEAADRKLELENRKLEDTSIRFERGDLAAGEVDRGRINMLTARKTRTEAVARYFTLLLTAAVSTGAYESSGLEAVFH